MNLGRLALASVAALVVYMALGGAIFGVLPSLREEFLKYPAVYRSQQGQMSHMPMGMAGMLLSIIALAVLYALMFKTGFGAREGAIFGALVGVYSVGSFGLHNYVNLNIGWRITWFSAVAYMVEWTVVGLVIGLIYRTSVPG